MKLGQLRALRFVHDALLFYRNRNFVLRERCGVLALHPFDSALVVCHAISNQRADARHHARRDKNEPQHGQVRLLVNPQRAAYGEACVQEQYDEFERERGEQNFVLIVVGRLERFEPCEQRENYRAAKCADGGNRAQEQILTERVFDAANNPCVNRRGDGEYQNDGEKRGHAFAERAFGVRIIHLLKPPCEFGPA